ncbi:hypothetical protein ASD21_09265 [Caulobacter sp. Root1455]|uniref:HXXEE domain-containing protein n=1 Tax=Caulobacter sp. Root1455 TaxID=1736465 RepID=UPI0006F47378|nr:HXXEE domain-containing protein [Caulobacter sp. Root1455]KQY93775.1 hypothetical protein ASD21_09265 [Caulobacter sp. Root1455]
MTDTVASARSPRFHRLIWLMPAAYALHIVEEHRGGFAAWVTHVVGGEMNDLAFALNNAAFMAILLALVVWTAVSKSRLATFLLIVWSSGNLFWDALFHVVLTQALDRYSPGLVTAALLYVPISLVVAQLALGERLLTPRPFLAATALGAGLMGLVIWYGLFHFAV